MSGRHLIDAHNDDPGTLRAELSERAGQWMHGHASGKSEGLQQAERIAARIAKLAKSREGKAAAEHVRREIAAELRRRGA